MSAAVCPKNAFLRKCRFFPKMAKMANPPPRPRRRVEGGMTHKMLQPSRAHPLRHRTVSRRAGIQQLAGVAVAVHEAGQPVVELVFGGNGPGKIERSPEAALGAKECGR